MRLRVLAPLAAVVLLLGACSSGGSGSETSASPTSAGPTLGPTVPPASAVAEPVAAELLPTATGGIGEKPTLTFPDSGPPPSLQRQILVEGTGPLTTASDWLITNYLGQVWGGEVFDNSYDRGSTSAFQIGVGAVVSGWDVGLVGVPVGSRVLLSLPPADGYGSAGNDGAGIGGTDTIVFVVDIIDAVGPDSGGQTDAVPAPPPSDGPQATGELGQAPEVTVPAGTPEPTAPVVTVLATGTGEPVHNGQILVQFKAVTWTGESAGSTWPSDPTAAAGGGGTGPQQLPVTANGPFAGLVDVPLGSRVLVQVPPQQNPQTGQQSPAIAAVLDLLAQTS